MKRFTLAAALLAALGLNIGCGGAPESTPPSDSPAPEVDADAPPEGDAETDAGEGDEAPPE